MTLQLSDLFKKTGKNFDWIPRIEDQKKLIQRLKDTADAELEKISKDVSEFVGEGVASMNYLENILSKVTKCAARKNIAVS